MRKIIFTICLFVCAMCIHGQGTIKMKGVDHLDKALLESIIKEFSPSKLRASEERPMNVRLVNVIHKDAEAGEELERGRAIIQKKRLSDGTLSKERPALTPIYNRPNPDNGYMVVDVTESTPPSGYNPHETRLVLYFNDNMEIIDMEANEDIIAENPYFTVIFLSKKK